MDEEGEDTMDFGSARVGGQLRAAREAQGLDLADIAARTRIPTRHLTMIEAGEYAGLPAATYSAGFVKTYARQLGLDAQRLSEAFRAEMGAATAVPHRPASYEPADPKRTPPTGLALLALLLAVVGGLGYLYWRGSADQPVALAARGPGQLTGQPAMAPHAPAPAALTAVPAPATGGPVVIAASEDVWIKVFEASGGKTLFIGTLKQGDRYPVPGDAIDPRLTTGRPGNTAITVGATPIPTLGDPRRAARNISLKPDALLARVATPPPAVQPSAGAPTPVEDSAGPT